MVSRTALRAVLAIVLVASLATVSTAMLQGDDTRGRGPAFTEDDRAVEPRDGITVITTSQYGNNFLVAFAPNGTVLRYDDRYAFYNEVVHVPDTRASIVYVATRQLDREACHATQPCNRNVIERLNLTTGERVRLYERINPRSRNQWHAIDLIDERHVLIGDIAYDRVFILDLETKLIEWEWEAQTEYSLSGGGIYPGDWTHLNHVEHLPDGRVMVSLRNQDQVVFIDRETGLQENWTLGADGDHDVLFEQHNPEYIPLTHGGPAVLVADSENGRVVEYKREDGQWIPSWEWSDARMQWPRDADRLPNGHTLIVDSNGARVFEVDRSGAIDWQVELKGAYDVEHIGISAGEETAESARQLGLESRTIGGTGPRESRSDQPTDARVVAVLKKGLPNLLVNGLLYVLPAWFGLIEFLASLTFCASALAWAGTELWWAGWRPRLPLYRPSDE